MKTNIYELPNEILLMIFKKIPAPYFVGSNSIALVCWHWNRLLQDKSLESKRALTVPTLHSFCDQDPQAAIDILLNDAIFRTLTVTQMLSVASYHPELAIKIFHEQRKYLNFPDLAILGKNNLELAKLILTDPEFTGKIHGQFLAELGQNRLDIAQAILSDNFLCSRFNGIHLVDLGKYRVDIGLSILNNDNLRAKLNSNDFFTLGQSNRPLVKAVLEDGALAEKIEELNLAMFACNNRDITQAVLSNRALRESLSSFQLALFGQGNPNVAEIIWKDPTLLSKLDGESLTILGIGNPSIAEAMVHDLNLRSLLRDVNLANLGRYNIKIARAILEDSTMRNKLNEFDLAYMGCDDEKIAQAILEDEELKNKLNQGFFNILYYNSEKFPIQVLEDPDIAARLDGFTLATYAQDKEKIAAMVLQNVEWLSKFNGECLVRLSFNKLCIARMVIEDETLCAKLLDTPRVEKASKVKWSIFSMFQKLLNSLLFGSNRNGGNGNENMKMNSDNIMPFCANRPFLAKLILTNNSLKPALDQSISNKLKEIHSFGLFVQEEARKLHLVSSNLCDISSSPTFLISKPNNSNQKPPSISSVLDAEYKDLKLRQRESNPKMKDGKPKRDSRCCILM